MSIIQISTAFNIDLEFELAAFHKRLLAYMIDFIVLIAYLVSMKYVLYNGFSIGLHDNIGLDILVISLPMLFYSLLTELWMNGQTFGKKLMSIRVKPPWDNTSSAGSLNFLNGLFYSAIWFFLRVPFTPM